MKTKITLLSQIFLIVISLTIYAQDSIPNKSFEYWEDIYSPVYWRSTNMFLPPGIATVMKTADSYEGEYAMRLQTIDIDSILVPAVATLGQLGMGYTDGGIPFSSNPSYLNGFVKHPSSGDEVFIAVQFYKNGNEIGGGEWMTTDSIGDYTLFSIPVSFSSNETPDTMNITILTDPIKYGSTLFVDNLFFDIETGLVENIPEFEVMVYPNPTSDYVFINPDFKYKYDYFISDMKGNRVYEKMEVLGQQKASLQGLQNGVYILNVIYIDNNFKEQKMIILSK